MKKLIFAVLMAIVACTVNGQTHKIYAFAVCDGTGDTPTIITEKSVAGGDWKGFDFKSNMLRDEQGNEIKFNNFLPMLAYLETIGWTIPNLENQIKENQSTVLRGRSVFLLSKEVSEKEWLEWIERGKFVKDKAKSGKDKDKNKDKDNDKLGVN